MSDDFSGIESIRSKEFSKKLKMNNINLNTYTGEKENIDKTYRKLIKKAGEKLLKDNKADVQKRKEIIKRLRKLDISENEIQKMLDNTK